MRFDVDRAMAHVRALDSVRSAGSEAERRAADYVAQQMQDSGLSVERREATGSRFPELIGERIGWLGLGVIATVGVLTPSETIRSFAILAAFVWLPALFLGLFRVLGRGLPPRITTPIVLGTRPWAESPRARLVVLTHLDSNPSGWSARAMSIQDLINLWPIVFAFVFSRHDHVPSSIDRWFVPALFLLMGSVMLALWYRFGRQPGAAPWGKRLGLVVGAACLALGLVTAVMGRIGLAAWIAPAFALSLTWMVVILRGWPALFCAAETDEDRDNRTGLALLIEIARAWPVEPSEGIEVAFAAVGARTVGQAGAKELARIVAEEWPGRPTLVINIQSPGYGNEFVLKGTDRPLWMAQTAARDLWIPHREGALFPLFWSATTKGHTPFARRGIDGVSLTCAVDPTKPRPRPEELLQPAMLGTTAQLAREVALRWRRRQDEADHPRDSRTAAKSDQKPG